MTTSSAMLPCIHQYDDTNKFQQILLLLLIQILLQVRRRLVLLDSPCCHFQNDGIIPNRRIVPNGQERHSQGAKHSSSVWKSELSNAKHSSVVCKLV